jgi:hypothetical protein
MIPLGTWPNILLFILFVFVLERERGILYQATQDCSCSYTLSAMDRNV